MMRLLALPVAVPMPTPVERAVLRLALRGLYPPAIAARLEMDEREVDATLRRLAKAYQEVGHATANSIDSAGSGDRVGHRDGGDGHGVAVADCIFRGHYEAGI